MMSSNMHNKVIFIDIKMEILDIMYINFKMIYVISQLSIEV